MTGRLAQLTLASILIAATPMAAQTRVTGADLIGTVRDESGGVLPGVVITVTNIATNVTRTAITDQRGRYLVAALPPGSYTVTAELQGFTTARREGVALRLGESLESEFALKVASRSETIIVEAEAPLVDPGRTAIASVIDREQIEALPINGRNFISFSVITPGVTTDRTPQQGASATSGLSFGGQRARSNNIMVDGYDNNDGVVGAVRAFFSQEAVRESRC